MKWSSIFYNFNKFDRYKSQFIKVKEFVEYQQSVGNEVKLPKLNEEVIITKSDSLFKAFKVENLELFRCFHICD
jgi:hypothetical protein